MNQTALNLFLLTLRVLLDDLADFQMYSDAVLTQGLQSCFLMNNLPGFALTPDMQNVTPPVIGPGTNPNNFALVVLHTVRLFVMNRPDKYEYKTRAMQERFGSNKNFLQTLENDIHLIENGPMFVSWQSYHAWVAGMSGLPVGLVLTNVTVDAPFFTANVSNAGVTITPSSPTN